MQEKIDSYFFAVTKSCHRCVKKKLKMIMDSKEMAKVVLKQNRPVGVCDFLRSGGPLTCFVDLPPKETGAKIYICEDPMCLLREYHDNMVSTIFDVESHANRKIQKPTAEDIKKFLGPS